METVNVENRKQRANVTYPAVMNYAREHPGQTAKQIYAVLKKTNPAFANMTFGGFSGSISNMVNTGRLGYRPNPNPNDADKSMYVVYFKTMTRGKRVAHGRKKRIFRTRVNGVDRTTETGAVTKAVYTGTKVDVQLLIAIGDRDTMIGFETARALYDQLKAIFERT